MSKRHFAKIFRNGSSQAVRLPKEFRFDGDRVHVRRLGTGVLLEPITFDVEAFFKSIDDCDASDFMAQGRDQPEMPKDAEISFD
jgi:antitoxin VapB